MSADREGRPGLGQAGRSGAPAGVAGAPAGEARGTTAVAGGLPGGEIRAATGAGRAGEEARAQAPYPWLRPLGAWPLRSHEETVFRVWAPAARDISLLLGSGAGAERVALEDGGFGVHQTTARARPGTDYSYLIDGRELPDPASRWQPSGLRGPSRVYAPTPVDRLVPVPLRRHVIYELHIGTFSAEGTFDGAIRHLPGLAALGVTAIELMPIAEFPGTRGWGYDGVYLNAAHSSYGGPAGLQRLVDAAHASGLAVILDVVHNHVGASGMAALEAFGPYFTDYYRTPWGPAINYDGADSDPVREWVLQSAEGWVRDFGVDGLRLDAVDRIFDASPEHILAAIARRVHAVDLGALVIAETAANDPVVVRDRGQGGYGCDAVWADDFHHALRALLTDESEGYYADFGLVRDLAKAWRRPFVLDGRFSRHRRHWVGAPCDDVAPERFVVYSQNHDQVGNRAFGDRMPAEVRLLGAMCTLLSPFTPLLFMGEEYGEDAPFHFFCDHIDEWAAEATRTGRRGRLAELSSFADELRDPQSVSAFEASALTREVDPAVASRYAALLALRRGPLYPAGEDKISFAEAKRWLRVTRGNHQIVCSFDRAPMSLPAPDTELVFTTTDATRVRDGRLELAPLSGAVLREVGR